MKPMLKQSKLKDALESSEVKYFIHNIFIKSQLIFLNKTSSKFDSYLLLNWYFFVKNYYSRILICKISNYDF